MQAAATITPLPHHAAAGGGQRRSARRRTLPAELRRRGFVLHGVHAGPVAGTIDDVVVAQTGVWVVLREHVPCARVSVRRRLRGRPTLRVGGLERDALITRLDAAVTAVRGELYDFPDAPVIGVACLTGGSFPLVRTLSVDEHLVVGPRQLLEHIEGRGPLPRSRCRELAATLAGRLG